MIDHEAVENSPELKAYYSDKRLFYKNVFWYLFGNCAALFGQNTAQTLMPLHMEGVGLNAQQISTILAMGGWLGMPLMLYFSHLTDHWQWKYGRRLPFLAMCLPFMITAMIVMPYASTMISCMAVYALYISFNQIKYTTYPYLLNDISKKCYWGRVSGLSMVIGCAGTWFGQFFLMPMVDTHGESFVFRTGAIFVAVATTLTLIFVKEPPIRNSEPPRFNPVPVVWSTLKVGFASPIRLATCLAFALVCGVGMAAYYVPLQGKANLGLTEGQIGKSILQFGTMAQVTLYFVGGWIVDKAGSAKCMIVGILLLVLAWFHIPPLRCSIFKSDLH